MSEFDFVTYVKIDLKELDNVEIDSQDLPIMQIKRSITMSDVMKYLKEINAPLDQTALLHIADLKERMVLRDAKLLASMGCQQIYLRDLAPGDTQISYILSSVNYPPSYLEPK